MFLSLIVLCARHSTTGQKNSVMRGYCGLGYKVRVMTQILTPEEYKKGRVKFGKLLIRPLRKNVVVHITQYQVSDGEYSI
ncbi:hypothetical protein BDD30_2369 [Photorhabdus asymbiotica]|uniref:Uncharacterized protein n=1 Tax=Photorhabdus asymbiotica TaxID=291112 RepID=A0ABX9SQD1_9GAMM|nr:hypothetical protein BDD30_2369 [Photorhabdus asymbiotica]